MSAGNLVHQNTDSGRNESQNQSEDEEQDESQNEDEEMEYSDGALCGDAEVKRQETRQNPQDQTKKVKPLFTTSRLPKSAENL